MTDTVSFAVVDQAINTLKKVNEYINAGMDTTIDVAQDLVENDKGQSHRVSPRSASSSSGLP